MYSSSQAINNLDPCSEISRPVWFKMNYTESEIFIRSDYTDVQKYPTFMVIDIINELDENYPKPDQES